MKIPGGRVGVGLFRWLQRCFRHDAPSNHKLHSPFITNCSSDGGPYYSFIVNIGQLGMSRNVSTEFDLKLEIIRIRIFSFLERLLC